MNRMIRSGRRFPLLTRVSLLLGLWAAVLSLPHSAAANDSNDAAMRAYLSANGMLNRGLYELAAAEYRKFLSSNEDHEKAPSARYGLGVSLFRMERYDDALEALSPLQSRDQFEFAAEVGTIIGQCHLTQHRNTEAAEAFKRVVRKHEQHDLADEAGVGLVEALYLDSDHDEAVASCQRFIGKWPESPHRERAEFFGGVSAMANKDYSDAAERFTGQLERFSNGQFAEQASLLLAQCHHHNNTVREAIRQYRKVLQQAGSRYIPDALHGLGSLLRREGHAPEAGQMLDQLLERYPDTSLSQSARFQRGRAWFDEGAYDKAFAMLQPLASEESEFQDQAAYWAAKSKLREGDFSLAAEGFEQAIDRFSDSPLLPEMLYDRAVALVRAGKHDEAAATLEAFRSRFAEHALGAEALELLATTDHQRRNYKKSRELCLAFLQQFGSHNLAPVVRFMVGENSFLAGNYDDAVTDYRDFLDNDSGHQQAATARFRLGTALYRLERFAEADDELKSVTDGTSTAETFRSALLALGDIHFQRSEWKNAEQYLKDYLSFGLNMTAADDALLKLGLSRHRQDDHDGAIEAYDALIASFDDSPHRLQAMFERGQALVALSRPHEAKQTFQAVLDADDDSRFAPYALNHLATMAAQAKDFEQASQLYERVSRSTSESDLGADALFQNAQSLMAAGQFREAESSFTRFVRDHGSHARVAEAAAQRAICLARQDRYDDALKALEQVDERRGSALSSSLKASLGYEKAWCLRELGRLDEAARAYRGLLANSSRKDLNTHAMLELSGIEFNAKRFKEAAQLLRDLREIIQSDPAQIPHDLREQTTYRLGVCEFELEQFDDAAELFEEFLDTFETSTLTASACYYCGEASFKLSRHQKAVKHLARVREEFQSAPVLEPSLLRLGESLAQLQRWPRSERVFTEYMERFSDSKQWFQAQFGIGWARENQSRYDEAVSAYRQVVDRHQGPTAARAQFQIGECLFAKKQYEEAVREFLKVDILYAYPEWSAAALYEAGRCFQKLGKLVEARNHFNQVAEQYGQTRWAEMASQQLTQVSGGLLPGR